MNIFDWQMGLVRAWTDAAQAVWKTGSDVAAAATQVATATLPGAQAAAPVWPNMWTGSAWPMSWPLASAFGTSMFAGAPAWPGFGAPNLFGVPLLANPWLQMFAVPGTAGTAAMSGWPFFGAQPGSWGAWPLGASAFGAMPQTSWPLAAWPMTGAAWPWGMGPQTQAQTWPWLAMPLGFPTPFQVPSAWGQFAWPGLDMGRNSSQLANAAAERQRASVASFRTSSGHATATVITEPVDLAKSMASFWGLDPDTNRRKPH